MTNLPLQGYRVLDFGTAWAGPMAGHLLADWGAEVIKVETRTRMDGLRMGRPLVSDDVAGGDRGAWPELQPLFHCFNRNKLGITIDFKNPKGLDLLKRLIAKTDVITYNYSPGVLERAGLGYQELKKIKKDIIVVSMPVAGEAGPLKDIVAYAPTVLALTGVSSAIGYENDRPLGMAAGAYCDTLTGIHGAISASMALYYRNLTGEGQYIEMAQWEATSNMFVEGLMLLQMTGRVMPTVGNSHPILAPHGNYPCSGEEDKWISIAVGSQQEWEAFCKAAGNPAWAKDPRFADQYLRHQHRQELDRLVETWTRQHTDEEITERLQSVGVAAMKLNTIETSYFDPHHQERQVYQEVELQRPEHIALGSETLPAFAWKISGMEPTLRKAAPVLGESNEYVFGEVVGLSKEEIKKLEEEKVLY